MHVAGKVALALGAIGFVGVAAWAIARRAGLKAQAPKTPLGMAGQPPPRPGSPQPFQDESGKWFVTDVEGKKVEVGSDGVTINGTHFSPTELGLTVLTGGSYASLKYYGQHPKELLSDVGEFIGIG